MAVWLKRWLTDVCNDAEYGVNGNGSAMDKVCSDVTFETFENHVRKEVRWLMFIMLSMSRTI